MSSKRFAYKAVDSTGKTINGTMEAASIEEVGTWLSDRQYFVLEINPDTLASLTVFSSKRISLSVKEQNYFFLQLSSLIKAGCPLIMSLQALHKQLPRGTLKNLLKEIKDKIEMGKSFSEALKAHPEVFSNLFITLVEVGEVGGILGEVLERYSQIYDAMYRIRAKIIKSMIYPALLLIMTLIVSWILLIKVFPVFVERIATNGGVLPLPTRMVLEVSNFISNPTAQMWMAVFFGLVFLLYRFGGLIIGEKVVSSFFLEFPLIGSIFCQIQLSLFSRTLGTLLKCGVPILTSLKAVERIMSGSAYKAALASIRDDVSKGESISVSMARKRNLFPDSLILMADVGERGGSIGEMFERAAIMYERDLETNIDALVSLIEPLLVIFLAIFIVVIAMAMYYPLFDIVKVMR
ncbi:type II secretion system F family protein [bacterium]|nr:type II secretion system F family protein [bacterium]